MITQRYQRMMRAAQVKRLLRDCPWLSPSEASDLANDLVVGRIGAQHMSAHRERLDLSLSSFLVQDSGLGNTAAGGGILADFTEDTLYNLQSTNATTAEVRTLKDPLSAFITLTFVLTVKTAQNLAVQGNTPMWLQATLNNFTQNGNFINFTAKDQWAQVFSVPTKTTSFTAVHNSPATNTTGFRWAVNDSDGATIN